MKIHGVHKALTIPALIISVTTLSLVIPAVFRTKLSAMYFGEVGVGLFGQVSVTQTLFVTLGAAGLVTASRSLSLDSNSEEAKSVFSWMIWAPTLFSIIIFTLAALANPQIATFVLPRGSAQDLLLISDLGIPFSVFVQCCIVVGQVKGRGAETLVASALGSALGIAGSIPLFLPGNLDVAIWSFVLVPVAQTLALVLLSPTTRSVLLTRPKVHLNTLKIIISISAGSLLLSCLALLSETSLRSLILSSKGILELALYQPVAMLDAQVLGMVLTGITSASMSYFGGLKKELISTHLEQVFRRLFPFLALGLALYVSLAPISINIFFIDSLVAPSLQLLTIAICVEFVRVPTWILGAVLLPQGKRKEWLALGVITVGIQFALASLLTSEFGAAALVFGSGISAICSLGMLAFFLRTLGIKLPLKMISGYLLTGLAIYLSSLLSLDLEGGLQYGPLFLSMVCCAGVLTIRILRSRRPA